MAAVAALGCAAALLVLARGEAGRTSRNGPGLAVLPLAAQGPVSAALGREKPAYEVIGLRARNPRQHLRIGFSSAGVTVATGGARLGLALAAYGYASALRSVGSIIPRASLNRVSYSDGPLREWFANGPLGLEQGFDAKARPGAGSGPLTFSLALTGNLSGRLQRGSLLLSRRGVTLRYGGLLASDAHGRVLRSWLELADGSVLIRVDDRGARYPLRIDPLIQQGELTTPGDPGEEFGESVAISHNAIVVGVPNHNVKGTEQGAAYVFPKPRAGWVSLAHASARLTATHGRSEELFGHSVSISGNTIVVGAPFREVANHVGQGAAYVFVKPASGWANAAETAKLTAQKGVANEFFGESVAVLGGTVVVGSPGGNVSKHARRGAVDIFRRPASGWLGSLTQRATLSASDGEAGDGLGISVSISGNTIVAGAELHKVGKTVKQGAAYVFARPRSGWANATESAELSTGKTGQADELFGRTVSISGNTVVVGAPYREVGRNKHQGELYVFAKPGSRWPHSATPAAELTASDGVAEDVLGASVAVSGNRIVAGVSFRQVGKNPDQGAAYVFVKPVSGWANATQTAEFTAPNGAEGDSLGRSAAILGKTIVAGSPDHRVGNVLAEGAVYVFGSRSP
jgi:hypothetical protein